MTAMVGCVLVRNEDVFIERVIRNIAAACDRVHVLDHQSVDRTPVILRQLAADYDHLEVVRSPDTSDSHRVLEQYVDTKTWVLGVDGDEIYDPGALNTLRADLDSGVHEEVFRLKGHVLNCEELRRDGGAAASGYLAPPSRPVTKLFNMS